MSSPAGRKSFCRHSAGILQRRCLPAAGDGTRHRAQCGGRRRWHYALRDWGQRSDVTLPCPTLPHPTPPHPTLCPAQHAKAESCDGGGDASREGDDIRHQGWDFSGFSWKTSDYYYFRLLLQTTKLQTTLQTGHPCPTQSPSVSPTASSARGGRARILSPGAPPSPAGWRRVLTPLDIAEGAVQLSGLCGSGQGCQCRQMAWWH